jgi:hypothetical protein
MPKFRKKPVEVEARQWAEGNGFQIVSWVVGHGGRAKLAEHIEPTVIAIDTLEGTMTAQHGDWIIRGVQGEFYPCKPDIFTATYEAVEA